MDALFQESTLILVGHGSTLNATSAAPAYQHADALRSRAVFGQVLECFWKLEPSIAGVRRGILWPKVFIVPLFISEGYFTEQVIPRELGFTLSANGRLEKPVQEVDGRLMHYCGPVGTHARMTGVILAQAQSSLDAHPFPRRPPERETALFVAGHGTGENENSRKSIERQVDLIRAMNRYAETHAVFMEESPRIGDCYTMTACRDLVMVPFFISDGLHSFEDIPVLLGEPERAVQDRLRQGAPTWRNPTERRGKRIWYTPAIGGAPLLAEVILERARELASPS